MCRQQKLSSRNRKSYHIKQSGSGIDLPMDTDETLVNDGIVGEATVTSGTQIGRLGGV